ncbi:nuclear transport factor 2 family protein [Prescottella sp. R16]|uniref:nuclear transport factor 2 family protein n=1 Tax=Prescottella sp. R16 TaxID=3064529 RepID=UPI00272E75BD|nr:nuclear transport factor 2 family protein [Prescottella sp. R16]
MTETPTAQLTLSPVEQLLAIEEIKKVFAGRLRVMDTKQWDLYGSFHTEDVVSETWGGLPGDKQPQTNGTGGRVVGREALTKAISGMLGGPTPVTTAHHGHTPEITLTSDTTATGIWPMEDELWWTNGDVEEHLHGYGHYHEEYRKVGDRWLISYRALTRLREVHTPNFFSYMKAL